MVVGHRIEKPTDVLSLNLDVEGIVDEVRFAFCLARNNVAAGRSRFVARTGRVVRVFEHDRITVAGDLLGTLRGIARLGDIGVWNGNGAPRRGCFAGIRESYRCVAGPFMDHSAHVDEDGGGHSHENLSRAMVFRLSINPRCSIRLILGGYKDALKRLQYLVKKSRGKKSRSR